MIRAPLRSAMLVVALGPLGGCWWHDSDVPAITEADRARRAPLRDGVYCDLADEGISLEDCRRFQWDRAERRFRVSEVTGDGEEGPFWLDVAALSGDLFVAQYHEEGADPAYTLLAIVADRAGYVVIPVPRPEVRNAIAAEEGVTVEQTDGLGRLLAGEPAAVRRVVERSAIAWLSADAPPGVDKLAPHDADLEDDHTPPHYVVRIEALDGDPEEQETIEAAVARLREAVERTATRAR